MRKLRHNRNPKWDDLKNEYLDENPRCAWCGQRADTVHHIVPVHVSPDREMDRSNLMSLCDNRTRKCHFVIGHFCNWRLWNDKLPVVDRQQKNSNNESKN